MLPASIYSTYDWWSTCRSNDSGFASYEPFWIAKYASSAGTRLQALADG